MCLSNLGSHSVEHAKSLKFQTEGEANAINKRKYPYKPDLLFSYNNDTIVSTFILNPL